MTGGSSILLNYKPCPCNPAIRIVDDSLLKVVGTFVIASKDLKLDCVLLVQIWTVTCCISASLLKIKIVLLNATQMVVFFMIWIQGRRLAMLKFVWGFMFSRFSILMNNKLKR